MKKSILLVLMTVSIHTFCQQVYWINGTNIPTTNSAIATPFPPGLVPSYMYGTNQTTFNPALATPPSMFGYNANFFQNNIANPYMMNQFQSPFLNQLDPYMMQQPYLNQNVIPVNYGAGVYNPMVPQQFNYQQNYYQQNYYQQPQYRFEQRWDPWRRCWVTVMVPIIPPLATPPFNQCGHYYGCTCSSIWMNIFRQRTIF